jgi:hypothetical protein
MRLTGMFNSTRLYARGIAIYLLAGWCAAATMQAAFAAQSPSALKPAAQQNFASADEAVDALVNAVRAGNTQALLTILGPGAEKLVVSGDPIADETARKRFLDDYAARHTLTATDGGHMVLTVGPNDWPMPVPLVQAENRWHFDAGLGAQEAIDRRIGRDELLTIRTLLASVEAEKDYFDRVKRGSGSGAYAQRMLSTPGSQDGLYWDTAPGEAPSPLDPLIEQARSEGYPGASSANNRQIPYQGYYYRILKAQGPNAPGGAKEYIKDGRMTEGFAFVAWPASFDSSGIVTFLVNQDGIVFQKDLGPDTASIVSKMVRFDPDLTWARVEIGD